MNQSINPSFRPEENHEEISKLSAPFPLRVLLGLAGGTLVRSHAHPATEDKVSNFAVSEIVPHSRGFTIGFTMPQMSILF